jgi:plasmid stabilization system protein ParE
MDYKVILSPRSILDLEEIVRYITPDDPRAAARFGLTLIQ